ncbi:hypothetical protein IFM89_016438 [Coptis chinensis]|uniref:Leucine-rich repeat-containing N-terminal plant-type domain-containing protein n=1 Tax=Coptis chinensis TaxID=261450 RepID=A0A835HFB8_9MAGN|nr:hypothetical protein IFM89_016438 [Coptis chinensis]
MIKIRPMKKKLRQVRSRCWMGGTMLGMTDRDIFLENRLITVCASSFPVVSSNSGSKYISKYQITRIYFCLRTGYYDEARYVVLSSCVSQQFAPQLSEWITSGGMVSAETPATALEECEKIQIDRLLGDIATLFNTIEDFLWFKLAPVRDSQGGGSFVLDEGMVPYTLDDLQVYLRKFELSYYTKNGKDPLVYPCLAAEHPIAASNPTMEYLWKVPGLPQVRSDGCLCGSCDLIRQYGAAYLRSANLAMALECCAQAAVAMGGVCRTSQENWCIFNGINGSAKTPITKEDVVAAVQDLYKTLNYPSQLIGWKSDGGDPCEEPWKGISCSGSSIIYIQLSGLDIGGYLGGQLGNLLSLKQLDVSSNHIQGGIPYFLPPNATQLDFSCNNFTVNIPDSLSFMKHLRHLNISHNSLSGPIGNIFTGLQNLKQMDLSYNSFTGDLPSSFQNLMNLTGLYLQNNEFTGSVIFLANLQLIDLNIQNNSFSGVIPTQFQHVNLFCVSFF